MIAYLNRHWVAVALCMGIFLLLLAPALAYVWDLPILLIYLQIPVYMFHQVEEHTGDRFREFVNRTMYGGLEALTHEAVLVINIPGVWGITLLSLYAALLFGAGWGLSAIYLVIVNGVVHVLGAISKRAYNPGLWTALALFLPLGGAALWVISSGRDVTGEQHAVGLAVALAIHIAIVIHTGARARSLAKGR